MQSPLNARLLGYLVIALSMISIGIGVKTTVDRNNDVDCLSGYIAENARVTKVRSLATIRRDAAVARRDRAVDDLIDGFTLADKTRPARQDRLFAAYNKATAAVREELAAVAVERERNPLPELPESCNDINRETS